ncbi:gastrula zinc finger protein XlCGF7.1-like [Sparus aurata]|uniref:gastrula zinc finger protein XlCGF7.1-like n=1 Tax=Sparus aurata TaxID=8175 RepID=UPI0011C0FE85|nr:gastrula zinc finger protein XlCGF7.1-like [Sparus aurata]
MWGDDDDEVEEEDNGDDEWKPDKNDKELSEDQAEPRPSKTTRKWRVKHLGDKTKRRKQKEASTENSDAALSCKVCQALHRSKNILIKHAWTHVDDPERLCGACGELKVHLRTHTKVTITCTECGKGLSSKEALNRHMIIHARERPYQCSECGLHFNRMSNLTAHMKIHTGVKSYVCGVCGKACARKTYLTVHMRTHSGERPYECIVCKRAFTQSHCL